MTSQPARGASAHSTGPIKRLPRWMLVWVPVCLWLMVAAMDAANIIPVARHATQWGVPWEQANGNLLDYRDIVVVPGRWLWHGGNPYDPSTYLAAHPWAQEFDPYTPSWLLISAALCWLPIGVGGFIYQAIGAALQALACVAMARWCLPRRWAALGAPVAALWLALWYPSRSLGSSALLACAAVALSIQLARRGNRSWWGAIALSVLLMKPQIGLPLTLFLLIAGHWRTVWRGWWVMVVASLPAGIACMIAAGGPIGFLQGLKRDVSYASSPNAPTGLEAANSYRIDLPGIWTRISGHEMSSVAQAVVLLVLVGVAAVGLRRARAEAWAVVAMPAMLLLPVHMNYDMVFMLVACAAAIRVFRDTPGRRRLEGLVALLAAFPVLHSHRVTAALGIKRTHDDAVDVVALLMLTALAVVMAWRSGSDREPAPAPRRAHHA